MISTINVQKTHKNHCPTRSRWLNQWSSDKLYLLSHNCTSTFLQVGAQRSVNFNSFLFLSFFLRASCFLFTADWIKMCWNEKGRSCKQTQLKLAFHSVTTEWGLVKGHFSPAAVPAGWACVLMIRGMSGFSCHMQNAARCLSKTSVTFSTGTGHCFE